MMLKTNYFSEAMLIGKTHWRLLISDFDICGTVRPCTQYQWRDQAGFWKPAREWPTYDHNDTYNGLPRGLAKLYERERDVFDFLIHGKPIAQRSLPL